MTVMNILNNSSVSFAGDEYELDALADDYGVISQELNGAINDLDQVTLKLDATSNILCTLVGAPQLDINGQQQLAMSTHNALVGTDAADDVTLVIPAMEDNGEYDTVLAAEGFREVISKIWAYCKSIKDRVMKALKKLVKSIFGRVNRTLKSAKALQKRGTNYQGKTAGEPKVKLTSTKTFMVEGKVVKDYSKISEHFGQLTAITQFFNDDYFDCMKRYGEALTKAVEDCDTTQPEDSLLKVVTATNTGSLDVFTKFTKENRATFKDFSDPERVAPKEKAFITALPLLGDMSLVRISLSLPIGPQDVMTQSEIARRPTFNVYTTKKKVADAPNDIEMPTMTLDQIAELTSNIIVTCETLKRVVEKDRVSKLEDTAKKITKAGDKFVAEAKKEDNLSPADTAKLNAVPSHIAKFESWIATPSVNLEAQFISAANALIAYGNKSLSVYK